MLCRLNVISDVNCCPPDAASDTACIDLCTVQKHMLCAIMLDPRRVDLCLCQSRLGTISAKSLSGAWKLLAEVMYQKGNPGSLSAAGMQLLSVLLPIQRWYTCQERTVGGGERACHRCARVHSSHTPGRVSERQPQKAVCRRHAVPVRTRAYPTTVGVTRTDRWGLRTGVSQVRQFSSSHTPGRVSERQPQKAVCRRHAVPVRTRAYATTVGVTRTDRWGRRTGVSQMRPCTR